MKLTPEQLRQNAAALIALADEKSIQFRTAGTDLDWTEYIPEAMTPPNLEAWEYRPRPEPVTRPWTPEEMRGKWVRYKDTEDDYLIYSVVNGRAHMHGIAMGYDANALLTQFTQLDGSPCGIRQ